MGEGGFLGDAAGWRPWWCPTESGGGGMLVVPFRACGGDALGGSGHSEVTSCWCNDNSRRAYLDGEAVLSLLNGSFIYTVRKVQSLHET